MVSKNLIGKRFGKLIVKEKTNKRNNGFVVWKCLCDCGKITELRTDVLKNGNTRSCGCLLKNKLKNGLSKKHGHGYGSKTYKSWDAMKDRCFREKSCNYKNYGGRGITICERWLGENGFKNFLKDMGKRPEGKTLDRINNDGNYEPSNCKWSTPKEQANNRRNTLNGNDRH